MAKFRRTPEGLTTLTELEDDFIKNNYLVIPLKKMAKMIGKSSDLSVRTRMKQLNLIIPPELAAERKKAGLFRKGSVPVNKGKKQNEYMSAEQIEKTKATRFQKGNLPHNTCKNDGEIRIRTDHHDRNGRQYKWIRISLGKWKQLHIHNWENVNGPVPVGSLITFKDFNSLNSEIDNLELITMEENMIRNSIHNYPEDIKEIMHIKGRIKRQINKHLKNKK